MQYKTTIEVIADADNEDEAIDRAGEYLRGTCYSEVPLKVQTQSLNRKNFKKLGYTIVICFVILCWSFASFLAGRTYQKMAVAKFRALESNVVHPSLSTVVNETN